MTARQILISAGETSGEMHAARLAAAVSARTGASFFGLGGPRMRESGVELLAECRDVSVVGISEVLTRLPAVWKIFRRLLAEARRRRPALAILVDFPDFNLRLARRLHAMGIRVVYFISPQLWAWRAGRVRQMKRHVERVLCIFPFETDFYRAAGVAADYVGHPLAETVRTTMPRSEFCARFALDPARPIVALLPGSRPSEIAHILPGMAAACGLLEAERATSGAPPCTYVLAKAPGLTMNELRQNGLDEGRIRVLDGVMHDAVGHADCAVVASGTATVETALLGTPMVVVYRVSASTAFLARRMVRVPHYAMVNLIAGRRIVPELVQEDFTPERVKHELRGLLDSAEARQTMREALAGVRRSLESGGNAIERAAGIVAGMLA